MTGSRPDRSLAEQKINTGAVKANEALLEGLIERHAKLTAAKAPLQTPGHVKLVQFQHSTGIRTEPSQNLDVAVDAWPRENPSPIGSQ